jgi:putative membrane protein
VDKLSNLSGVNFDRAYIKDALKDHRQDVKEFQNEAENGSKAEVKSFASKTLPTLHGQVESFFNAEPASVPR